MVKMNDLRVCLFESLIKRAIKVNHFKFKYNSLI